MLGATLVLRDIHQPPAPPLWPPAPGWWLLVAALLLVIAAWAWFATRRRKRRRLVAALFDEALRTAPTPAEQVAAMSELLRRAARRRDPAADRLDGEAWLEFLDRGGVPLGGTQREAAASSASRRRRAADLEPGVSKARDESHGSAAGSSGRSALRLSRLRGHAESPRAAAPTAGRAIGAFSQGPGRLLLEGAYRREVDPQQVAALKPLARARFLEWMAAK